MYMLYKGKIFPGSEKIPAYINYLKNFSRRQERKDTYI